MTELFQKVRGFVKESFHNNIAQMKHFDRTVHWVKVFKPDADEAFLIAAVGHDIERAFRKKEEMVKMYGNSFKSEEGLMHHQKEGAKIIEDFLVKNSAERES